MGMCYIAPAQVNFSMCNYKEKPQKPIQPWVYTTRVNTDPTRPSRQQMLVIAITGVTIIFASGDRQGKYYRLKLLMEPQVNLINSFLPSNPETES